MHEETQSTSLTVGVTTGEMKRVSKGTTQHTQIATLQKRASGDFHRAGSTLEGILGRLGPVRIALMVEYVRNPRAQALSVFVTTIHTSRYFSLRWGSFQYLGIDSGISH